MISINGKDYGWREGMTLSDVFMLAGYTLKKPSVLVHVNGELVRDEVWDTFEIHDSSVIEIVNLLRGG